MAATYWTQLRGPVFDLLRTIENRVDRDLRRELEARAKGMRVFLLTHVRVARRTWEVIEAITTDRAKIALSIEVSVAVAPLSRTLLESVFFIAYVFEDPRVRLPTFWHTTWARISREYIEYSQAYGSDPMWTEWLQNLARERDTWRDDLAEWGTPVPQAWLANPIETPWWPNPGQMLSKFKDPWRSGVLKYLNDRYYAPLSNVAHLSSTGFLTQGGAVSPEQPEEWKTKYALDRFHDGLAMLLVLISEYAVDVIPEPAFARRIVKLWTNPSLLPAMREVYDQCFKVKLEPLASR